MAHRAPTANLYPLDHIQQSAKATTCLTTHNPNLTPNLNTLQQTPMLPYFRHLSKASGILLPP